MVHVWIAELEFMPVQIKLKVTDNAGKLMVNLDVVQIILDILTDFTLELVYIGNDIVQ